MAIELKFNTGVLLVLQNLVENHDLFEAIGGEIEETDEILRVWERGLELKARILWVNKTFKLKPFRWLPPLELMGLFYCFFMDLNKTTNEEIWIE